MTKVVNKFIDELRAQVKDKAVRIKISKDAINWLIDKGFDPKMGARPLQRVIDKEIKRDLAKMMLFGDLKDGGVLDIKLKDNKINLAALPKKQKQVEFVEEDVKLLSVEEIVV
jgi:ATP-dependent Clp protease ATP-binding subunit ClpA